MEKDRTAAERMVGRGAPGPDWQSRVAGTGRRDRGRGGGAGRGLDRWAAVVRARIDSRVYAAIGTPVEAGSISGRRRRSGGWESMDASFTLRGPSGEVTVELEGESRRPAPPGGSSDRRIRRGLPAFGGLPRRRQVQARRRPLRRRQLGGLQGIGGLLQGEALLPGGRGVPADHRGALLASRGLHGARSLRARQGSLHVSSGLLSQSHGVLGSRRMHDEG